MPAPPAKRRKLTPSDEGSDADSFASFREDDAVPETLEYDVEAGSDGEASRAEESEEENNKPKSTALQEKVERKSATASAMNNKNKRIEPGQKQGVKQLAQDSSEALKTNLFKLQMDDLLGQTRPKFKKDKSIERTLRHLKDIIEGIPARGPASPADAEALLKKKDGVRVPFPDPKPPKDANYKLQYVRPSHVNVVGSFPLNNGIKTGDEIVVDLLVTIPEAVLQEKDYLNYRYIYKRAFYLSCLAAGIKSQTKHKYKLTFDYLHGNRLLPVLVVEIDREIQPKHDLPCKSFKIVVLPSSPESFFSQEKLLPSRNCVRSKDLVEASQDQLSQPTPLYNASLRVDGLLLSYLRLQHESESKFESYKDACMLGRVWLRQRGFSGRIQSGGFGNFEWSALTALLLRGGGSHDQPAFPAGYSSYQLFKAALQYLATKDLLKHPQFVGGTKTDILNAHVGPTLFDVERGLNILFKMSPSSYRLLQHEAKASIAMLNDTAFDHFRETFILRGDRVFRYDAIVKLSFSQDGSIKNDQLSTISRYTDLYHKLTEGLADRVKLISFVFPEDSPWPIQSESGEPGTQTFMVGFILDPPNAQRLIDHGPSAEDKLAAAKFRKFWGDKSELRRFRDGSILETVIWPAKSESGHSVFRRVLSHILERHAGKQWVRSLEYKGDLDCGTLPTTVLSPQSASVAIFQPIMEAFRSLEQDLRALDDMPLSIRHLLASDPYLSYSSVDTPFVPGTTMNRPATLIIQFEGSARWPDDLDAIQRTKMAFFLKVAESLEASSDGIRARVGLENEDQPFLNQSFLDIHYFGEGKPTSSGAAFRVRIHHDRELVLLERQLKDKALTNIERVDVASAIATYKRVFIKEPAHTQALQTLATRFPAFSGTVRLLIKWIAAHNLSNHFPDRLVTMFAARAFTNPYPWNAASSPQTGFYRTLFFLSRWDWHSNPWIVDLGSDMRAPDVEALNTRFAAWRKIDPALNRVVVFAASNVDGDGNTWTDNARPAKVVAGRMVALAKAATNLIVEEGIMLNSDQLFESSLDDFDLIIHLDQKVARPPRPKPAKNSYKNLELQEADAAAAISDTASIGFDAAGLFLTDLEHIFGDAVLFFYDDLASDTIAALWNPSCESRAWKLSLGYSAVPTIAATAASGDGYQALLNHEGIVNEIARLGGDLIKKIDVNRR